MFGRRRVLSARPSLSMFRIGRPIAWISSSLVDLSQWLFHFGEVIGIVWTQEKTTTLDGTVEMGDSGTSRVLIRYESMRLRSLRQSERTTARDQVQHKR